MLQKDEINDTILFHNFYKEITVLLLPNALAFVIQPKLAPVSVFRDAAVS
jgi:hypothetical protein